MSDPNRVPSSMLAAEESFFDLLGETLQSLDRGIRGQFLSRFFKAFATIEITDGESAALWDRILARHRELTDSGIGLVSLKAVMVDVLQRQNFLQVPVVVEYRELRKLQVSAGTDALTGLYNRRLFEEYFEKELSQAKRSRWQLALVIMDLYRFKEVNDRYGHQKGDQALRLVAAAARDTVRSSDFSFRIGGDEFAILLPQCDRERCAALSRRLRARYESVVRQLYLDVPLTLDYGIAVLPDDGDQRDGLIRVADRRLYEMKNAVQNDTLMTLVAPIKATAVDKRKWERILLTGTSAHVVWNEQAPAVAPMIDVSYGGVALMVENPEIFPTEFPAVLHVPTQLPVKVVLRKAYTLLTARSGTRLGCTFISAGSEMS